MSTTQHWHRGVSAAALASAATASPATASAATALVCASSTLSIAANISAFAPAFPILAIHASAAVAFAFAFAAAASASATAGLLRLPGWTKGSRDSEQSSARRGVLAVARTPGPTGRL